MSSSDEDLGFELPVAAKTSRGLIALVLVGVLGAAFAIGYMKHRAGAGGAEAPISREPGTTAARVEVIAPKPLQSDQALVLPGVAKALEETKIFSRTQGYVRKWLVDIGDKVKEGQLLAEIDTPDLDSQIAQGRAQLAQAKAAVKQAIAQRDYSKSSSGRYETLADQKLVAKAQVEQQQAQAATDEASVAAAESNVAAQEANVRRLMDLKQFASVTAPFAGTITTRSVDRGALVGTTDPTPMFTLVATDPIRVFVDVPQTVAPSIKTGADAAILVREFPGKTFSGKITRSAGALDPDLHMMSTEIRVPNPDGTILPGMYVQAQLTLPVPHRVLEVPSTALYTDAQGVRVAVVDATNHVHFVPVTIERDTGATFWIATGLTGDEKLVKIAVPSLVEGDLVEVAQAPAAK